MPKNRHNYYNMFPMIFLGPHVGNIGHKEKYLGKRVLRYGKALAETSWDVKGFNGKASIVFHLHGKCSHGKAESRKPWDPHVSKQTNPFIFC